MQAAFYCSQGPTQEVMRYGEQPLPEPAAGEVRVRLHASGVNPSDWKVRKGGVGRSLIGPLIIPHSDGAGAIDAVGEGVPASRIGERVWIWNGQWKRPFGTAAQYIALPSFQPLSKATSSNFSRSWLSNRPAISQDVACSRNSPATYPSRIFSAVRSLALASGGAGGK